MMLSFVPDVLLLVGNQSALIVGVLMVMHVVAWAISVGMLTTLARIGRESRVARPSCLLLVSYEDNDILSVRRMYNFLGLGGHLRRPVP